MKRGHQRRPLDLALLPAIESMDIFVRLDPAVDKPLKASHLAEVYERAQCAVIFFSKAHKEDKDMWLGSGYLRAGLNEFYSLEDAAVRDCRRVKLHPPGRIRQSSNPLIHLMYLLRHANVHASLSRTRKHDTTIISNLGGERREFEWASVVLDSPCIEHLKRSSEAQECYDNNDLLSAASWLDEAQQAFGVGEVFKRGLEAYCKELLAGSEHVAQQAVQGDAPAPRVRTLT
jgi:hypothetical protein